MVADRGGRGLEDLFAREGRGALERDIARDAVNLWFDVQDGVAKWPYDYLSLSEPEARELNDQCRWFDRGGMFEWPSEELRKRALYLTHRALPPQELERQSREERKTRAARKRAQMNIQRESRDPSCLAEALGGADVEGRALDWVRAQPVFEKLSPTDREEVERIVRKQFKEKTHTQAVEKVAKETLRKFVQTLYTRRGFWMNEI